LAELIRGLYMILFYFVERITGFIVACLGLFQLIFTLITGRPNDHAVRFGRSLARYITDIVHFLSYNSDRKPWPFASWPSDEPAERY
jgi:hypothetical protein